MLIMAYSAILTAVFLVVLMLATLFFKPQTPTHGLLLTLAILIVMMIFVGRLFFRK